MDLSALNGSELERNCIDSRNCGLWFERRRYTIPSILLAGITGWALGVAQLAILGGQNFGNWDSIPLLPLFSALAWSSMGMVLGGSGLFAKTRVLSA